MGDAGYSKMGESSDVEWTDPTGNYAAQQANLANSLTQYTGKMNQYEDPNAAYNSFMGQSEGLANLAQGATAPLTQSLNAVASREAALGSEAALAAMPGSAQSGAGMAAFGGAYADPFAKAQAQIQSQQLDLTGQLWNTSLNQNYDTYNQRFSTYAGLVGDTQNQQTAMATKQGDMWSPTYQKNNSFWDYALPIASLGTSYLGAKAGAKKGGVE